MVPVDAAEPARLLRDLRHDALLRLDGMPRARSTSRARRFPGPIDREPQCHVFYDQRADWVQVGDSLPRYTSDDPGLAKFKDVPA